GCGDGRSLHDVRRGVDGTPADWRVTAQFRRCDLSPGPAGGVARPAPPSGRHARSVRRRVGVRCRTRARAGVARAAPLRAPARGDGGLMMRAIRVLELRSVRGTGGGPEKTILLGSARTDAPRFAGTVCSLRDKR